MALRTELLTELIHEFHKMKVRFHFVLANKTKVDFYLIDVRIRTRALDRTPQR
jgi:hypothetical protein